MFLAFGFSRSTTYTVRAARSLARQHKNLSVVMTSTQGGEKHCCRMGFMWNVLQARVGVPCLGSCPAVPSGRLPSAGGGKGSLCSIISYWYRKKTTCSRRITDGSRNATYTVAASSSSPAAATASTTSIAARGCASLHANKLTTLKHLASTTKQQPLFYELNKTKSSTIFRGVLPSPDAPTPNPRSIATASTTSVSLASARRQCGQVSRATTPSTAASPLYRWPSIFDARSYVGGSTGGPDVKLPSALSFLQSAGVTSFSRLQVEDTNNETTNRRAATLFFFSFCSFSFWFVFLLCS